MLLNTVRMDNLNRGPVSVKCSKYRLAFVINVGSLYWDENPFRVCSDGCLEQLSYS